MRASPVVEVVKACLMTAEVLVCTAGSATAVDDSSAEFIL